MKRTPQNFRRLSKNTTTKAWKTSRRRSSSAIDLKVRSNSNINGVECVWSFKWPPQTGKQQQPADEARTAKPSRDKARSHLGVVPAVSNSAGGKLAPESRLSEMVIEHFLDDKVERGDCSNSYLPTNLCWLTSDDTLGLLVRTGPRSYNASNTPDIAREGCEVTCRDLLKLHYPIPRDARIIFRRGHLSAENYRSHLSRDRVPDIDLRTIMERTHEILVRQPQRQISGNCSSRGNYHDWTVDILQTIYLSCLRGYTTEGVFNNVRSHQGRFN